MKNIFLVVCALALSAPAFAEDGQDGYAQRLSDPGEIQDLRTDFKKDLKSFGFTSAVQSCDHQMMVAVGARGGNISYGAICILKNSVRSQNVMFCNDKDLGRFALLRLHYGFVVNDTVVTQFVRQHCYGG